MYVHVCMYIAALARTAQLAGLARRDARAVRRVERAVVLIIRIRRRKINIYIYIYIYV